MPHFTAQGFVYHTTSTTKGRAPVFADTGNARIVIEAIDYMRKEGRIFVLAYSVMPDHLHLLFAPRDDVTLAASMKAIKNFSARRINQRLGNKGSLWQEGFFDRVIRDDEQLQTTVDYIHQNAVEAGLSQTPEEYAFSSAHPDAEVDLGAFFSQGAS